MGGEHRGLPQAKRYLHDNHQPLFKREPLKHLQQQDHHLRRLMLVVRSELEEVRCCMCSSGLKAAPLTLPAAATAAVAEQLWVARWQTIGGLHATAP